METEQTNYLTMVEATEIIFGRYTTTWSPLGAFAAEVTSVRSIYETITGHSLTQLVESGPVTDAKDTAKKTLATLASELGGKASVLAEILADLPAAALLNQSYSDIYYATDADARDYSANLLKAATDLDSADLLNYGVTAKDLTDLNAALETYKSKMGTPRAAIVEHKAATDQLPALFDGLRTAFSRLDRLAPSFRTSAPAFLAAYEAARIIVDRAATHAAPTAKPSKPA
jgi:hypothetical protein